jgi:hypothetical protein
MFDASLATWMTGWRNIEFETKIILLTISNNMHIAIFMYFIIVLVGMCIIIIVIITTCDKYFIIVYIWNSVHVLQIL